MTIAHEILNQIGGARFLAFTGSKNLVSTENGLMMKLTRNKLGASYLHIELNGLDLYDMTFIRIQGAVKKVKCYNDIYNDQLEEIFTEATGLYTKF
jgi:hypothetical protein